jgi:hypothetical protein
MELVGVLYRESRCRSAGRAKLAPIIRPVVVVDGDGGPDEGHYDDQEPDGGPDALYKHGDHLDVSCVKIALAGAR